MCGDCGQMADDLASFEAKTERRHLMMEALLAFRTSSASLHVPFPGFTAWVAAAHVDHITMWRKAEEKGGGYGVFLLTTFHGMHLQVHADLPDTFGLVELDHGEQRTVKVEHVTGVKAPVWMAEYAGRLFDVPPEFLR